MFNLQSYLTLKRKQIDIALLKCMENSPFADNRISQAMKYSLMAGGKRLRPILCLAALETVCEDFNSDSVISIKMQIASALELIHTYSLIHDDLPAMDDDNTRRGKLTLHKKFDEATAILAGDSLLTMAFAILSVPIDLKFKAVDKNNFVEPEKLLKIINIISIAAGREGMIEGQMQDIQSEGVDISIKMLEKIHILKTGALIEASVKVGAILGDGNDMQIKRLSLYAKNIGLAFQVTDDILNVEGDPEIMGKAVGTDNKLKKVTYPTLLGLDKSKIFANELISNACDALNIFNHKAEPLRAIAQYIIKRKR